MFDFVNISVKPLDAKGRKWEVYPEFLVKRSKDLMIRGKAFYAVWNEDIEMWCTDENYIQDVIDKEIRARVEIETENRAIAGEKVIVKGSYLKNFSSNKWTEWQKYVKSMPDNYHELDTSITFANTKTKKTDYISKRLSYELVDGECNAYDELMNVLYDEKERQKLEWAVGSIISGDSRHIQKFIVLYGPPGSGKSTFLKIVEKLFEGYCSTFEAKALGSVNSPFALEAFKDNPLVAIQHDGDLSRIADNTKLNQIISHEDLVVNEKYKSTYSAHFNSFLFLGTNKPVKITEAKSGIIRRLIDVEPTGDIVSPSRYSQLRKEIEFELGSIANHCLKVYNELGETAYDDYRSIKMMGITNDIFNFLNDYRFEIKNRDDWIALNDIWKAFKDDCIESNIETKIDKATLREELKHYFKEYKPRTASHRDLYRGLIVGKFVMNDQEKDEVQMVYKFQFNKRISMFDEFGKDMQLPAQYANEEGTPEKRWADVTTTLEDIDTSKLHYVKLPKDQIVIDFDLKDENGNKSFEKNLEAANKWPATYAELSKSGGGIHLHYIYDGDVDKLAPLIEDGIEVKVFKGNAALRRKLTKCNDIPIATINSGLPLKEEKKMVTDNDIKNERHLRNKILYALRKEGDIVSTTVGINYIYDVLKQAYESDMHYDVSNMAQDVYQFASNSSNQAPACLKKFTKMHFKSKDFEKAEKDFGNDIGELEALPQDANWRVPQVNPEDKPIIFLDVEVFPNVFIVCWKYRGEGKSVTRLVNPPAEFVKDLILNYRIIGFNNRDYDNHMLWAYGTQGYTNYGLFLLSQRIIVKKDNKAKFAKAYGLSYTDVYDFSNTKMGLKKWEIELGISHMENSYAWDQDLPEDKWNEVRDYCANDVIATEKVFDHLHEDWTARKILALLSGLTVNDTTNAHTTRIIVGDADEPWHEFVYTKLEEMFPGYRYDEHGIDPSEYDDPNKIVAGKSIYRGEDPGEGGYVYAEPGMYTDVALLDIASMHPNSALNMNIFGRFTERYRALVNARLAIKHKDYDEALKQLLFINPNVEKELREYLSDGGNVKALAYALKIPINSVYGLTSAKFQNKLKDPRNIDNIVAKRGALFMINLKHEVQKRGFKLIIGGEESNIYTRYTVAHIKTDSIKIPKATPEIIQFVMDYGKQYGYTFEHEATYDRMCLVNDAVYIAKYKDTGEWTATGKEFQVPYVFKTLFTGEQIEFADLCQTINVKEGELYLDYGEDNMKFVGKIGSFVPVKPGCGGAPLFRVKDGKKYAAPGTKGYEWLEAEYVKNLHKEDDIDMSYFEKMADKAIEHINEFGSYDKFVNDPNYDPQLEKILNVPEDIDDEVPFDEDPQFMNKPA